MQIPAVIKRNSHHLARGLGVVVAAAFIAGVAWTGSHRQQASHAYTGHHSSCSVNRAVVNSQAVTSVSAGQTFQGYVYLLNDGTTTWSPNYGFFFGENGGTNYWNATGTNLSGDIPPGATAHFFLTLKAPSTAGTYPFSWAIGIVFQGQIQIPCTGSLVVNGPPGNFSVSSSSQTTSSITFTWTNSAGVSHYQLYRDDRNINDSATSPYTDSGLSCNTTHSYLVNAVNNYGSTASNKITVGTSACPAPPSSGSTGGQPATGGSGGGSSTSTSGSKTTTTKTATPKLQGSSNTATPAPADTTPPAVPDGFTANLDQATATVELSWNAAIDSSGIKAYQLDRSTDQQNWQTLTSDSTSTTYLDTTLSFTTHYFYRLRATDNAGNTSDFATTDVTTQSFDANAFPDKDSTVNDDSNRLAVKIPSGALSEAAQCAVVSDATVLPPSLKNYKAIDGPYRLLCKSLTGSPLTLTKGFSISWTTTAQMRGGIKTLDYFALKDNNWKALKVTNRNNKQHTDTMAVEGASVFTAMGKIKHTPIIVKILIVILIVGAIGAVVFFILLIRLRRQQQTRYDDYIHKEYGI